MAAGLFVSYPVLVRTEGDREHLTTLRRLDVEGRPHPEVVAQAGALHDHVFATRPAPCEPGLLEP